MKLVIPISQSDAHLAKDFCNAVLACPNKEQFEVLIPHAPSVWSTADMVGELLAPVGPVTKYGFDMDPLGGWPKAPNRHFSKTAQYLAFYKNTAPWLWCELDSTPLVPGWLDRLWAEYRMGGKRFMGTLNASRYVNPSDGAVTVKGQHMVGVGVYPHDMWERSILLRFVSGIPFDVFLEHEIVPNCHATDLIQHAWHTCDYRRDGDQIVCSDVEPLKFGISHKVPVNPTAVMHHGCKDGSLARLIAGEDAPTPIKPSRKLKPTHVDA
jgi:hypothetical protein